MQRVSPGIHCSDSSHFRTIQRQDSFDMGLEPGVSFVRESSSVTVVVWPTPWTVPVVQPTESSCIDLERASNMTHSTPNHHTSELHSEPLTLASLAMASIESPQAPGPRKTKTQVQVETQQAGDEVAKESPSNPELEDSRNSLANTISMANVDNTDRQASEESTANVECVANNMVSQVENDCIDTHIPSIKVSKAGADRLASDSTAAVANKASLANTTSCASAANLGRITTEYLGSRAQPDQYSAFPEPNGQGPEVVLSEGDRGIEPCTEGGEERENGSVMTDKATDGSLTNQAAESVGVTDLLATEALGEEQSSSAEHQDKKKGEKPISSHSLNPGHASCRSERI